PCCGPVRKGYLDRAGIDDLRPDHDQFFKDHLILSEFEPPAFSESAPRHATAAPASESRPRGGRTWVMGRPCRAGRGMMVVDLRELARRMLADYDAGTPGRSLGEPLDLETAQAYALQ